MDHADALRIVIFEYLLPMQRRNRVRCIESCLSRERIDMQWVPESTAGGCFEHILLLSDRLLGIHGFATSYVMPFSMMHHNPQYDSSRLVQALVDSPGPYRWCCDERTRLSDPEWGIRTFRVGRYMPAGRIYLF